MSDATMSRRAARGSVGIALGSLLALVASATAGAVGCGSPAPAAPPPSSPSSLLGNPAPSFQRDTIDGARFTTASSLGKVVVVKFVAKYCEPCKATLPAIERLHVARPDVAIVAVSEDETESDARELASSFHLTFPVVHDRQQVLAARWRVHDLPVTYVLDGHGKVAWVGGPEKTERDLVAAIEAMKP